VDPREAALGDDLAALVAARAGQRVPRPWLGVVDEVKTAHV
jgi:hypothetical protein